ncbi:MAG: SDR family oxidoreductase [Chloroflexota bacterium]|nr:SDR family oxidoreductase [Chloroflexota bacterium]MDE2839063.1 SDR family oxidoreductase [Chloroflexota bacterium]MDE2931209.1 SDR family oxidoreductase [Chloroflexota bacterium]
MYDLSGQVAVVTGGASGIGGATARRLAADGAKVLIADINGVAARENAARITAAGGEAGVVVADMGNSADIAAMVEGAVEHWGRLDILVNNAYSPTAAHDTDIPDTTEEAWDSGLAVMAKALFLATKHAIPHMERNGGGNIVNISSVHGLLQSPGFLVYEASKSAVIGMTRQMAAELGPRGIRVNAICPGHIVTENIQKHMWQENPSGYAFFEEQYPLRRCGKTEEIASAIAFLCSSEASFITGHALVVDGGLSLQLQENLGVRLAHYIQENPEIDLPY